MNILFLSLLALFGAGMIDCSFGGGCIEKSFEQIEIEKKANWEKYELEEANRKLQEDMEYEVQNEQRKREALEDRIESLEHEISQMDDD